MKIIFIFICLFCFTGVSVGQDTIEKVKRNKKQVMVIAGGNYKNFWGKRYIEPDSHNRNYSFTSHQFDRFTKKQTFGFQGGVIISPRNHTKWPITFGILFYNRKDIYQGNYDSVVKYNAVANLYSYNIVNNAIKYKYSFNDVELPLMVQYKLKDFTLYGGLYFSIFSYRTAKYTYLVFNSQSFSFYTDTTTKKTVRRIYLPLKIFPTLTVSYDSHFKDILFSPYLGIDLGSRRSIYITFGVIIPFNKSNLQNFKNNKK